MIKSLLTTALLLSAAPIAAQSASTGTTVATPAAVVSVKHNDTIVTADGKRLGQVDMVRQGRAMILRDGGYVSVPVASLSADGNRFRTTLNWKEIDGR